MNINPATFQHILKMNNNNEASRYAETMDSTNYILDLCTRRQPRTPPPDIENKPLMVQSSLMYAEVPTSTVGVSSPGSETSEISTSSDLYRDVQIKTPQTMLLPKVKVPRPFKAYPKDPLSLAAAECVLSKESTEAYAEFRNRMLAQVHISSATSTNKNMRRVSQGSNSHNREDATYWEKRRKNNEAAKRSRDARRAKEDELAIRAAFLERENLHLRCEVANMRIELEELRTVVYRRPVV